MNAHTSTLTDLHTLAATGSEDGDVQGYTIFRVNVDRDEAVIVKQPSPAPTYFGPWNVPTRNGCLLA